MTDTPKEGLSAPEKSGLRRKQDELPTDEQEVLFFSRYSTGDKLTIGHVSKRCGTYGPSGVTHWMIPEPPTPKGAMTDQQKLELWDKFIESDEGQGALISGMRLQAYSSDGTPFDAGLRERRVSAAMRVAFDKGLEAGAACRFEVVEDGTEKP